MEKLNDVALDFNLLRIFQVVYITRSTVMTAEKLNVSQSQVSRALQKLRVYYNDVLFIRSKQGFTPTPLATNLADVIPRALDIIDSASNVSLTFDPNTSNEEVTIALGTAFQNVITFSLLEKIVENAPNIKVNFVHWDVNTPSNISSNFIDLGINYSYATITKDIYREELYKDSLFVYVRKGHPLINRENVLLKELVKYDFCTAILKGYNDNTPVSVNVINSFGLNANVKFRSEVISTLIDYVKDNDAILIGAETFIFNREDELSRVDINVEDYDKYNESDRFYTSIFYNLSNRKDDKTIWLIEMIKGIFKDKGII